LQTDIWYKSTCEIDKEPDRNIERADFRSYSNRSGYNNMGLIPLPVKTQQRKMPNNNNQ
jgi:hypothetical protein